MVDYRVRFVGDLGNLKQFDAAVQNSMGASARALEQANLRIAQSAGVGTFGGILNKDSQTGRFAANIKTEIDSVNRTFIQSGDIVRRYISGYKEITDEAGQIHFDPVFSDEYISNFRQVTGNYDQYLAILNKTQKTEAQITALREKDNERLAASLTRQREILSSIHGLKGNIGGFATNTNISDVTDTENLGKSYADAIQRAKDKIKSIEAGAYTLAPGLAIQQGPGFNQIDPKFIELTQGYQYTSTLERELQQRELALKTKTGGALNQPLNPQQLEQIQAEADALKGILAQIPANIDVSKAETVAALKRYEEAINQETGHLSEEIQALQAEYDKLKVTDEQAAAKLQTKITKLQAANPAYGQLSAALSATPPINADLQKVLNQSKQLRSDLIKQGLGAGARYNLDPNSDFAANLAKQEAAVTKYTKNFRTGVTTVEGSIRQLNAATGEVGSVEKFTADIDKNGKTITRWGGQLSGTGSILKQTVRDFQKVIEWTIATTAVFGTLGLAISSLKTINDLNTNLTRFSITAQISVGEARDIFKDLGRVAIDTATPLSDLVKVADDIALATKTAGDSTEEWKTKIIQLTTAVGIFTNLTGEDTVQGADKLSSAFKQLSIAPKDLITVLNQVTAAAGGQSTAINDIVTALGGVGEAGTAAQLKIKEQIGLVQVLGQVTNKSAADTATAFKNLFGSISSPGSEKILAEFGISVRDATTGGLKPFLDIYREINKALEQGIIPANRYQDVLRGIAGGPRRAPDAAALLGNLPAVEASIARAGNASNEALIANAKILDTNQAKIQQLQNTFDIALFEKFGEAVQNATASVTDFLTALLNAFSSIDPKLVSLLLTLGAITLAAKAVSLLGGRMFGGMIGGAVNLSKSMKFAIADIKEFIAKQTLAAALSRGEVAFNATGQLIVGQGPNKGNYAKATDISPLTPARGITAGIGGIINTGIRGAFSPINTELFGAGRAASILGGTRGLAGIGLATAGLAAFGTAMSTTNNETKQTIGQILQLAGTVGLMTGAFTPLSIAALAAGTAFQFFGNDAQEAKQSAHDSSVAVYDAIQKLKEARESADQARAAQSSAQAQLNSIIESGAKDAATKEQQTQATKAFVTATLDLADANQLVSKSYDDLLAKIPNLNESYSHFKDLAKNNFIPQDQLKILTEQLAGEILKAQNLGSLVTGPVTGPIHVAPATALTAEQQPNATLPLGTTPFNESFLTPQGIQQLFDLNNGGVRTATELPVSQQNLAKLASSLDDIVTGKVKVNLDQDQIDTLVKAVNDFIGQADTVVALQNKTASDQAIIQSQATLGSLSGDQLKTAQNRADIASALSAAARSADVNPVTDKESRLALAGTGVKSTGVSLQQVQQLINEISAGEKGGQILDVDQLTKAGTALLALKGSLGDISRLGPQALKEGIAQELVKVGLNAAEVEKTFGLLPGTLQLSADEMDALTAKTDAFTKASASALDKFAQRNAQLLQQQNSGDFKGNSAGLEALQKQSRAAYDAETHLITSVQALTDPALTELQTELSKVIGLENAANLSGDQLAGALIDQAIAAGVNAKGIQKIQAEVVKLINLSNVLSRIRTTYNIKVNVDARGALAILKALLAAQVAFGASHHGPTGAYFQGQSIPGLQNAINELQAAIKAAADAQSTINTVIAGGKGSTFGSLPKGSTSGSGSKAKVGLDVSNLDLPDEIANASNRDALIKQAIANAKTLQSKIPGATKDARNDVVELLKGTQRILEVRGVKDDLLRKALEELAAIEKKRLDFETKADVIRRIRVGQGDFAAIANVPVNSTSGVSLGSPNGPINVTLNLNGTVLTPAQLSQFADLVASALKRQIANG